MTAIESAAPHVRPTRPGRRARTAMPAIAFLGTGRMGKPHAANMAHAGFGVQAWSATARHPGR
jgi:3-hydroxyisobutyrate dehydrogenase